MKTSASPARLSFGSAAIHMRSSPSTCVPAALGAPKVVPPSSDLLTVMLGSVRLENARTLSEAATAVSCGPSAQSQAPPPTPWSGRPMNFEAEPSCKTRNEGQPPPTPVGPVTNERPNLSVRMLGSAAPLLPVRSRFVLNVAAGGAVAPTGDIWTTASPARSTPAARTPIGRNQRFRAIYTTLHP